MIVHKYGTVTVNADGPISVEGWNIEIESSDPKTDATPEQLMLMYAIQWAQKKFSDAVQTAQFQAFLKKQKELKAKSKARPN